MRRDRDGSVIEEEPSILEHRCKRGWIGEDSQGRPIPCLVCKPHLAKRLAMSHAGGDA